MGKIGSIRMTLRNTISLVTLALLLIVTAVPVLSQTANISVEVALDRDTIGMDEHAVLQVVIAGPMQNLPAPKMPTLPMFEVYSQGRSSNMSITNGVVSSSVIYRYLVLPQKPGTFPIDNIAVVHNNRRYKGNRVDLTVLQQGNSVTQKLEEKSRSASGETRDLFLESVVDKTKPYVNEQVTLTLKFYIAVRYFGSPELSEPSLTGFWNEVLGNKAPYYQKINERTYKVIERKYALFPTQTGKLTIGRAAITATVATADTQRRRDPFNNIFNDIFGRGKEVTVRSNPITINISPLPEAGKPRQFSGSIGRYSISASVNKKTVEVNQPVSLTVKITGVGNIKSVAEPHIPKSDDFRVYRESSRESISKVNDQLGGTKTFEEVFIPRRPGKLEIPGLKFSYFNPSSRKYEVVRTRPFKLTVTKPEGYAAAADLPFARPELSIGSRAQDIRYIKTTLGDIEPAGTLLLTSHLYLTVNVLPILVFISMVAVRLRRERLSTDVAYARSHRASRMARKRLGRAHTLAGTETSEEFYAEISVAITTYIADRLNISPNGLTTQKLRELLTTRNVDETTVTDLLSVLKKADFARFAPTQVTADAIKSALIDAEDIMVRIESVKLV